MISVENRLLRRGASDRDGIVFRAHGDILERTSQVVDASHDPEGIFLAIAAGGGQGVKQFGRVVNDENSRGGRARKNGEQQAEQPHHQSPG